ncbi:barstar family protein [Streptomyces sp. NPDC056723]|uniref:barstar family protein n=1 Tax=Streptomyces sp. NPDC056723 TaxID=3345925 RepID=UPI003681BFF2
MSTIDVSGLTDERALHLLLKQERGFPDFYGSNWDAFWMRSPAWSGSQTICVSSAGSSSWRTCPVEPPCFDGRWIATKRRTAQTSSLTSRSNAVGPSKTCLLALGLIGVFAAPRLGRGRLSGRHWL